MSSHQEAKPVSAEARFRQAFERLKGTSVTQNNVAREASCDPSALKKARFPQLVREIQAYIELHNPEEQSQARKAARRTAAKRSDKVRLADAISQRDRAQSILLSAEMRIMDLWQEVQALRARLEDLQPPPIELGG